MLMALHQHVWTQPPIIDTVPPRTAREARDGENAAARFAGLGRTAVAA